MNMVKRVYLTINLAALWIAALLVCDAVGIGRLSFLYGAAVMFVKLARGWWSDTLPLPKKFRVQPSFFGNPIFFIHSVSIPHSALI